MPKPDDVGVGTAVLIFNEDGQVLLGKRKGSHRAGHWSCPGGWLDREDQTSSEAVIREAAEEVGLSLASAVPLTWTSEDHPDIGVRTVTLYHVCLNWSGEVQLLEPDKCGEWSWFDLDSLPSPLFPGVKGAIGAYVADPRVQFMAGSA